MSFRFVPTAAFRFKVRVVTICLCWYAVSSASSITNKVLLQRYPYPITLALSNLMWVPIYSIPVLRMWEYKVVKLTSFQHNRYLIPISVGKAIAAASAYFSLWKVPVSYAHTVKASMPLFSVLLSRIILKETQSKWVYLSLLPIVAGVIVASATELSFSFVGMFSALLSTFTYSLLNILVKKLLKISEMHPIRLLAVSSQFAAIFVFPFWLFKDASAMVTSFASNAKQSVREVSYPLPLTRSHTVISDSSLVLLNNDENNDIMYRASSNRSAYNGSRLGEFDYSDVYLERYDKMDDISKEQYSRKHIRCA
ncbi:putative membrane protein [Dictyocaulus viviparus]|uniref:Putative membrane protein n=1 Tax=Dictyocaulus viviparus TaxID=29172 RepID=A0A0D8Y3Q6_DICVI|nr:putative membrane protein [Dictyocaulus viviparus]